MDRFGCYTRCAHIEVAKHIRTLQAGLQWLRFFLGFHYHLFCLGDLFNISLLDNFGKSSNHVLSHLLHAFTVEDKEKPLS